MDNIDQVSEDSHDEVAEEKDTFTTWNGDQERIARLQERKRVPPWDHVGRYSPMKNLFPMTLYVKGLTYTASYEILEQMNYDNATMVVTEFLEKILTRATQHKDNRKIYQLLLFNGAFGEYYGFDSTSYLPIPAPTLRFKLREVLGNLIRKGIRVAERVILKLKVGKPTAEMQDLVVA